MIGEKNEKKVRNVNRNLLINYLLTLRSQARNNDALTIRMMKRT